ncbi:S8 family serine peptidase [Streptomyces nogalater]
MLDTGVDTGHPDLSAHITGTASFVQGQSVQDGNGHGTHCIGTAAGRRSRSTGRATASPPRRRSWRARCSATRAAEATARSSRGSPGRSPRARR